MAAIPASEAPPTSVVRLSLVVIRVAELERARRFYEEIGLQFAVERHGNGPEHLACRLDGLVFEIYPAEKASTMAGIVIGFRVPSLAKVLESLRMNGADVISNPCQTPWGLRAVVRDPDGHRVELTEG